VGATERLVLFPTWLLLDLLGVVVLNIFGYEQVFFIKVDDNCPPLGTNTRYTVKDTAPRSAATISKNPANEYYTINE